MFGRSALTDHLFALRRKLHPSLLIHLFKLTSSNGRISLKNQKTCLCFSDDEIYTKNMAPFGCEGLFMTGTRCCQCSWTNSSLDERASAVEAALKAIRSRLGGGYFVGWMEMVGVCWRRVSF